MKTNGTNDWQERMPPTMREQFQSLRKALFLVQTITSACLSITLPAIAALLVFISDRIWETPTGLRQMLHSTGLAAMALSLGLWVYRWTVAKPDYEKLARLVQRFHKGLGDRLLGVVELCEHAEEKTNLSPELREAAIRQVAAEAKKYDFNASVERGNMILVCRAAVVTGSIWILLIILSPSACLNALHRWWEPVADVKRYSLVGILGLPESKIVPRGEALDQGFEIQYRSIWKPKSVQAQLKSGFPLATTLTNQAATLSIPGLSEESLVEIKIGDAWHDMTVQPVYRPSLHSVKAEVQMPEYLHYPNRVEPLSSGSLKLLEGSLVQIQAQSSRPLQWAKLHGLNSQASVMEVVSNQISSGWLDLSQTFQIGFSWMDQNGLTNSAPWTLTVTHEEDRPPFPKLENIPSMQLAILESEILDFTVQAQDDFGVKAIGFEWNTVVEDEKAEPSDRLAGGDNLDFTDFNRTLSGSEFSFSPVVHQLPPNSMVEIRAYAVDFFPGRARQYTDPLRLFIINVEDHFEMVRESLEGLLTDLEDVTRVQDEILNRLKSVQQMSEVEMKGDQAVKPLEESIADQEANRRMLEQISKSGLDTFMEAMRNPMFDPQALKEWSENIQKMQELAQQSMPQASQSMQSAKSQSDQRPQKVAEAKQQEQKILEELEELQSGISGDLDDLEAQTLAQRLRELAKAEVAIREDIKKVVIKTIGLKPDELTESFRASNRDFADSQIETRNEAEVLTGEIGRYFERTQVERYGEVAKDIESSDVLYKLEELSLNINKNIALQSIEALSEWEKKFLAWADQLEPPKPPSEGGESEGGEGGENEAIKKLLENLVQLVRAKQEELGIRRQTKMLEAGKTDNPRYADTASNLLDRQESVSSEVRGVQMETLDANLEFVLNQAFKAMQNASGLLEKPLTDASTDNAMASSLLHLSDAINLINEQIQRSNDSNQSSEQQSQEMAFLLQLMNMAAQTGMTMQPGNQPGQNNRGGDTQQTPDSLDGNFRGKRGDDRGVIKGSGLPQNTPAEFRRALENYYRLLESEVQP